jgi:hypothetical protein
MARSVYFSFHYQDVIDFRANVVRNSYKFRKKSTLFRDNSIWEEAQEKQVKKIKQLIDSELKGSSVTCVLVGDETYSRRWVRYEIVKSFVDGKGQVGVGINWIKGKDGKIKFWPGENPFDYLKLSVSEDGTTISFFEIKDGDWVKYRDLPSAKNRFFAKSDYGRSFKMSRLYNSYSYDWNGGKSELTNWIEKAALNAGR